MPELDIFERAGITDPEQRAAILEVWQQTTIATGGAAGVSLDQFIHWCSLGLTMEELKAFDKLMEGG